MPLSMEGSGTGEAEGRGKIRERRVVAVDELIQAANLLQKCKLSYGGEGERKREVERALERQLEAGRLSLRACLFETG